MAIICGVPNFRIFTLFLIFVMDFSDIAAIRVNFALV